MSEVFPHSLLTAAHLHSGATAPKLPDNLGRETDGASPVAFSPNSTSQARSSASAKPTLMPSSEPQSPVSSSSSPASVDELKRKLDLLTKQRQLQLYRQALRLKEQDTTKDTGCTNSTSKSSPTSLERPTKPVLATPPSNATIFRPPSASSAVPFASPHTSVKKSKYLYIAPKISPTTSAATSSTTSASVSAKQPTSSTALLISNGTSKVPGKPLVVPSSSDASKRMASCATVPYHAKPQAVSPQPVCPQETSKKRTAPPAADELPAKQMRTTNSWVIPGAAVSQNSGNATVSAVCRQQAGSSVTRRPKATAQSQLLKHTILSSLQKVRGYLSLLQKAMVKLEASETPKSTALQSYKPQSSSTVPNKQRVASSSSARSITHQTSIATRSGHKQQHPSRPRASLHRRLVLAHMALAKQSLKTATMTRKSSSTTAAAWRTLQAKRHLLALLRHQHAESAHHSTPAPISSKENAVCQEPDVKHNTSVVVSRHCFQKVQLPVADPGLRLNGTKRSSSAHIPRNLLKWHRRPSDAAKNTTRKSSSAASPPQPTGSSSALAATSTASKLRESLLKYRYICTRKASNRVSRPPKSKTYCLYYCRFGSCKRGAACTYIHDPTKITVCRRFLKGTCTVVDCPLWHKVEPEKMPHCRAFTKTGFCFRPNCPYAHVKVSPDAPYCEDFQKGYCKAGASCKKRHEYQRRPTADKDKKDHDPKGSTQPSALSKTTDAPSTTGPSPTGGILEEHQTPTDPLHVPNLKVGHFSAYSNRSLPANTGPAKRFGRYYDVTLEGNEEDNSTDLFQSDGNENMDMP